MKFPFRAGARIALLLLVVLVTVLSVASLPPSATPGNFITRAVSEFLFSEASNADKVGHFIAYFVLGMATFAAGVARRPFWLGTLLLAAYGVGLEGVQYFLPYRTAEFWDAIVNGAGAATGSALAAGVNRLLFGRGK